MIFCCSGFYYGVKYDKGDLTEEKFHALWNHATARYFRRTVNKKGAQLDLHLLPNGQPLRSKEQSVVLQDRCASGCHVSIVASRGDGLSANAGGSATRGRHG